MIDQDTVERRVTTTLRAQADRVNPEPRPFHPDESTVGPMEPGVARRSRRPAWSAAALVAAACLAFGFWALAGRGGNRAQVSTTPDPRRATTAPSVGLAPGAVPSGLVPVNVAAAKAAGLSTGRAAQLFGSPGRDPELLIELSTDQVGGTGTPTTVRGIAGHVAAAKDFSSVISTLTWQEGGVGIQASFRGITLAQAESLLHQLTWSSPSDHLRGFVPSAGASSILLGEVPAEAVDAPGPTASALEFDYADQVSSQSPGQGRQLTVRTTSATGTITEDYLMGWLQGSRRADGVVESFDPAFGTLTMSWPDGHDVWIDANRTGLTQSDEQQVADRLVPVTEAEYLTRQDQVAVTMRRELPLIVASQVAEGTLEVRGNQAVHAVCLVAPSGPAYCSGATQASVGSMLGSTLVDGRWKVVVAALGPIQLEPPAPTMAVTQGGWTMLVGEPADNTDSVVAVSNGQGEGVSRPAA